AAVGRRAGVFKAVLCADPPDSRAILEPEGADQVQENDRSKVGEIPAEPGLVPRGVVGHGVLGLSADGGIGNRAWRKTIAALSGAGQTICASWRWPAIMTERLRLMALSIAPRSRRWRDFGRAAGSRFWSRA